MLTHGLGPADQVALIVAGVHRHAEAKAAKKARYARRTPAASPSTRNAVERHRLDLFDPGRFSDQEIASSHERDALFFQNE